MSNSIVREALLTSVACTRAAGELPQQPAVDRAEGQLAVRRGDVRAAARGRAASASLVAEKYGSMHQPGARAAPSARGPARAAARTAARCAGPARRWRCAPAAPVRRSHSSVVSRWLVMPMARDVARPAARPWPAPRAPSPAAWPRSPSGRARPSRAAGRSGGTRAAPCATMRPCASKTMLRELDVPWSSARMWPMAVLRAAWRTAASCRAI